MPMVTSSSLEMAPMRSAIFGLSRSDGESRGSVEIHRAPRWLRRVLTNFEPTISRRSRTPKAERRSERWATPHLPKPLDGQQGGGDGASHLLVIFKLEK